MKFANGRRADKRLTSATGHMPPMPSLFQWVLGEDDCRILITRMGHVAIGWAEDNVKAVVARPVGRRRHP